MELYANALFHRKIDAIISHERKIVANMRLTDIACSLSVPTILLDLRCEITLSMQIALIYAPSRIAVFALLPNRSGERKGHVEPGAAGSDAQGE